MLESPNPPEQRVAVLIPCCNEEATIARVVTDFVANLPQAVVYVYDNNSRDRTAFVARAAGAVVRNEPLQGKGHVVRRMFADVEADAFFLVDGDDTLRRRSRAGDAEAVARPAARHGQRRPRHGK